MPFLIGIPSITMQEVKLSELGDAVVLDADNNKVQTPFKDFETLPFDIVFSLKRRLKSPNMMGDGVARAFMQALVHLIGGYRDALKMNCGEKITFDEEAFIKTRASSIQPFLETILHLQIFHQFIDDRLEMLNSGIGFSDDFELEVNNFDVHSNVYLKHQYREWVSTMRKEGGTFLKNVKSKTNPAVKSAYRSVKDKSRKAYKDIQLKIKEIQRNSSHPDLMYSHTNGQPKSAPSSPTYSRKGKADFSSRFSYANDKVIDGINLPNSISVAGIRKYKMLTVDEIKLGDSDPEEETPDIQPINMDLMGDLQDIIFRGCSSSSDGLMPNDGADKNQKVPLSPFGFEDSFCSATDDVFLPKPVPPPRTKRKIIENNSTVLPNEMKSFSKPLINLDSFDDESLFDPLKSSDSPSPLVVSTSNSNIDQLKEKIQNIHSQQNLTANSTFPAVVNYPQATFVHSTNFNPSFANITKSQSSEFSSKIVETQGPPPIPPKKLHPLSSNLLSKNDKDLLDDYGLGNSPIFKRSIPLKNTSRPIQDVSSSNVLSSVSQTTHSSWQQFS